MKIVLIKDHTAAPFNLVYVSGHRVVSIKGNQFEIIPASGGKTKKVQISNVKYVLQADNVMCKLPDYTKFGHKSKLWLNPDHIMDLHWQLTKVPTLF